MKTAMKGILLALILICLLVPAIVGLFWGLFSFWSSALMLFLAVSGIWVVLQVL